MKKIIAMLLTLCIVFALAACGNSSSSAPASTASSAEPAATAASESGIDYSSMTIAWSPANLSNELQVTLTDNIKASVEALGANFLSGDPQGDPVTQVEQVENYIARGVDMILMSPNDASACVVVLKEAVEAGIPMIIVNCMMDDMDGAVAYVGCDDLTAGELLMEYAAGMLGGEGTIGILRGPDGLDAAIKRTTGIDNVLANYPGISVFSSQAANWKTAEAMSTTENWLQSADLNAIVCENDEMAVGAVEAVKGQGKSCDDVLVFGIDGIPSAYESIANGEMKATLLQDAVAIAQKTVEVMELYFEGAEVDSEYIIPWTVVDSSNIAQYIDGGASAPAADVDYSGMTIAWSPANLSNELQVTLTDNIKASVEALGANFLSGDPQGDPIKQVEQVENYIARDVDMILMSPNDASACVVVLKEAVEAGIPMIIVNCMMDDMDGAVAYVGCDDLTAGELLMEYAAGMLGGEGTIGILRGPDGLDAAIKRTTGIDNVLANYPGIEVFSSQAANWKTAEAMSTTENWLQSATLNAVVCENDEMAVGAVEAVKGQGQSCDDVLVFGIDGIPSAYESIANGEMKATLLQDAVAIAEKTVEVMQLYFAGGSVDSEYIIPWTVVDSSNIADFYQG